MSLDAQRDELTSLASKNGLAIAGTFEDAVFSGNSDDRPGFQSLISEIKNRGRGWSAVLVYDTSRIARGRFIAQAFKRECKQYGVELLIARLPETDPVSTILLESMFEAMDEVHSIMSRDKGLAGMRQNIVKGWRAGGRAPYGYRLVHETTGGMRDGRPVMKSKLQPSEHAEAIREYLIARATREPRHIAAKRFVPDLSPTSLVDLEWNALVYAGATVWNRHREKRARGDGMSKRRDRSQWVVQRDTHPALITELQAEAIISQLESSKVAETMRLARAHASQYLLAGLLTTSDGRPWVGAGRRYRLKSTETARGRYVNRESIERSVMAQIRRDVADNRFIEKLTAATREWYPETDPGRDLDREAARLTREADRAAGLALQTSEPSAFIQLMETKRRQADAVRRQAEAARKDHELAGATRKITSQTVRDAITAEQSDLTLLRGLVSKIVLEPDLTCTVEYLPALGRSLRMASPGRPVFRTTLDVA